MGFWQSILTSEKMVGGACYVSVLLSKSTGLFMKSVYFILCFINMFSRYLLFVLPFGTSGGVGSFSDLGAGGSFGFCLGWERGLALGGQAVRNVQGAAEHVFTLTFGTGDTLIKHRRAYENPLPPILSCTHSSRQVVLF